MKQIFDKSIDGISKSPTIQEPVATDEHFVDLAVFGGEAGREDAQGIWHDTVAGYFNNVSILDVGAGLGQSKARMNIRGITITTQDPGPGLSVDISCLIEQVPDKSFDVVTAFDVIEHIVDMDNFVTHMHRIARKYIVLTTPNFLVTCNTHVYHHREMTPAELTDLVGGAEVYHHGWCMFPTKGIQSVDLNGMRNAFDPYNSCIIAKAKICQ